MKKSFEPEQTKYYEPENPKIPNDKTNVRQIIETNQSVKLSSTKK